LLHACFRAYASTRLCIQGKTRVAGLYRQIELLGVGRRSSRSAGRTAPGAPTDHRRDLLLKASTARDEAAVGRVAKGV
jgi:hypothetical protein